MITRRQFLALAAATLVSTACTPEQPPKRAEPKESFAFLQRADDTLAAQLWNSGSDKLFDKAHLYATNTVEYVPLAVHETLQQKFPNATVTSVTNTTYGYPEHIDDYAQSYLEYGQSLIAFAENALPTVKTVPLEYLVAGKAPKTTHTPYYVDWFKLNRYIANFEDPNTGRRNITYDTASGGGMVINAFSLDRNADGNLTVLPEKAIISVSTGFSSAHTQLVAPLSEYYGLALMPGAANHIEARERDYGGLVPPDKYIALFEEMEMLMEAMSEGISHHLFLDYAAQNHVKKQLPSTIRDDVVRNCKALSEEDMRYQYVPAAFAWIEKEGLEAAADAYLNDTPTCVAKLHEYKK